MHKSKITKIIVEIVKESISNIVYTIEHNLIHIGTLIILVNPYLMYVIGQVLAMDRGIITIGGEIFLPVLLLTIAYFIKSVANKLNKGPRIPRPTTRFTEVDEDGIVSIEQHRLDELLVYVSDLEDWMERKGWL